MYKCMRWIARQMRYRNALCIPIQVSHRLMMISHLLRRLNISLHIILVKGSGTSTVLRLCHPPMRPWLRVEVSCPLQDSRVGSASSVSSTSTTSSVSGHSSASSANYASSTKSASSSSIFRSANSSSVASRAVSASTVSCATMASSGA